MAEPAVLFADHGPPGPEEPAFPQASVTRAQLVDLYAGMAPTLLRHLRDRPVNLDRPRPGPEGRPARVRKLEGPGGATADPAWEGRTCGTEEQLAAFIEAGAVELYPWLAPFGHLDEPDRLVIDLVPPAAEVDGAPPFRTACEAAAEVRVVLEEVALVPFVMTTGGPGLEIVVPLDGCWGFDAVRTLARELTEIVAQRHPERYTTAPRPSRRKGRLYLGVQANVAGRGTIAPYAVRRRSGAPVSTPLDWAELEREDLSPSTYTAKNIRRRLGQKRDPWEHLGRYAVPLDKARELAAGLDR